jgi:4-hydroxy-3-polyprenylbenzoate decarboxylase
MTKSENEPELNDRKLPFILAITGASGACYGLRLLQYLLEIGQPVELLISRAAMVVMKEENDLLLGDDIEASLKQYLHLADIAPLTLHRLTDYGASVASGSYRTRGMAVLPCSLGTLGAIANGLTENLIHRAATVCLKEKRPLLICLREMPFGHIQLKNMLAVSEAGGIVSCASPGYYHRPQTINDQIDFVVGRVLDQFGFDNTLFKRWKEKSEQLPSSPPREKNKH